MRRQLGSAAVLVAVLAIVPATAAFAGVGSGACISVGGTCFASVQAAVDAAHDGDTVRVPAGRFPGGVTITKSITLAGAGAPATVLVGGEHVLTIGSFESASAPPTVHVSGLTLTGGAAHSSVYSQEWGGADGVMAGGAGLEILPTVDFDGPTVTVTDTVVTGNTATPVATNAPDPGADAPYWPVCPTGFCPFAMAWGAGIDNFGHLTLLRSQVTGNTSAGVASDADGGGIANHLELTVDHSSVDGNRAVASAPNGRFSEGGGIFSEDGTTLTVRNSSVSGNTSSLTVGFPELLPDGSLVDTLANSGGIHVGDQATVTIRSSHLDRNTVRYVNPDGHSGVFNAALQVGWSPLELHDTTVRGNVSVADVGTTDDTGPGGGTLEWDLTANISGVSVEGNTSTYRAHHGGAGVSAAVASLAIMSNGSDPGPSVISDSVIRGNVSTAISSTGPAVVDGAGLMSDSNLTLRNVLVTGNVGIGRGVGGTMHGAGIVNGPVLPGAPADVPSPLTLVSSTVTHNALIGSPSVVKLGGGIFSTEPVTRTSSTVSGNLPDQCVGCDAGPTPAPAPAAGMRAFAKVHAASPLRQDRLPGLLRHAAHR